MDDATTGETTVWRGSPSQLIALPTYVLLALGAILATVGLLALRDASVDRTVVSDTGANPVFTWLIPLVCAVCALIALGQYLRLRSVRYVLTSERLRITTGIMTTVTEEIELRRVRDTSVVRTLFARMTGLGDIRVTSADPTAPRVLLRAVRDPDTLQSTIRTIVQRLYARHGVREVDIM
ncbi:MAG: PH domain-containing protein [Gemmatimonadaceae bacterium]